MGSAQFVIIDLDPCAAAESGLSLRFKRTPAAPSREIAEVPYEPESSDGGGSAIWRVAAIDSDDDPGRPAVGYEVEDSSDGTVWLVAGGAHGLRLTRRDTGAEVFEPYLLFALHVNLS